MLSHEQLQEQRLEVREILMRAENLYAERDAKYKGLWADAGASDNAFHLRHKALRVFRVFHDQVGFEEPDVWCTATLTEDAYDLINYCLFYIWCVENGRMQPQGSQDELDDIEASFVANTDPCPVCGATYSTYNEYQIATTPGVWMRQYNPCHHIIHFEQESRRRADHRP